MHNINTNILCQANWHDRNTYFLLGVVLAALSAASVVGVILERREKIGVESALVHRFNHKLKVWWMMIVIFALGFLLYRIGIVILFGLVSFWALREFITMTPTRRGDHRSLFGYSSYLRRCNTFSLPWEVIPQLSWWCSRDRLLRLLQHHDPCLCLFIPARAAIAGDYKRFLERSAKIQFGLLICVYSLSYAPALLDLKFTSTIRPPDATPEQWQGSPVSVLVFFVLIAQLASVFERGWGTLAAGTSSLKRSMPHGHGRDFLVRW